MAPLRLTGLGVVALHLTGLVKLHCISLDLGVHCVSLDWGEFHCISIDWGGSLCLTGLGEFHSISLDWGVPLCLTRLGRFTVSHWTEGSSTVSHWTGVFHCASLTGMFPLCLTRLGRVPLHLTGLGGVVLHLTGLRTTGDWCLLGELASHRDKPFISPTLTSPKRHTSYIVSLLSVSLSALNRCHDVAF